MLNRIKPKLLQLITRTSTKTTITSRSFTSTSSILSTPSSSSSLAPYPFSTTALIIPSVPTPPTQLNDSLLRTLNSHLTSLQHPNSQELLSLFSRRSTNRILPGSILTVTSYTTPPTVLNPNPSSSVFSGVLIAVRRRHNGRDLSFRLRNLIGRIGVEISFKLFSPLVKDVKIVLRAETSGSLVEGRGEGGERKKAGLRASKRAKMYFVRDQPTRLVGVGGIVKQQREREEKEALAEKKRR